MEVWRTINGARMSPSETFDGAIRRKLKMIDAEPEIPDNTTMSVSDEVYKRLDELWEPDETFNYIIGELFNVDWASG